MPAKKITPLEIAFFTLIRVNNNTIIRMAYPFLPILAAGMGVDVAALSLALSASLATSAAGPFLAPIADRRGRKSGMRIGLGLVVLGALLLALWPSYPAFFAAILLGNLGNNIFAPALNAYLSDRVPYARRGLVLSIGEMSWALSYVLIMPLVGPFMTAQTWSVPYVALAAIAILAFILVEVLVKKETPVVENGNIFTNLRQVFISTPALAGLGMGFALVTANEVINVIFSVWITDAFAVEAASLGLAALVVGISELGGEGLAAAFTDKVGKERSVLIGLILNALFMVTIPLFDGSIIMAMAWLLIFYLTFEYAIVASIPLMSEVLPSSRATMLAVYIAALSLGRAAGALLAPWLYDMGILANALVGAGFNLAAILLLRFVKIPKSE